MASIKRSSVKFLGKKHSGHWSEDFVYGLVYIFKRLNYKSSDIDLDKMFEIKSPYFSSFDEVVGLEEPGIYTVGIAEHFIGDSSIKNKHQLKTFLSEENGTVFYSKTLLRYLTTVSFNYTEVGGYEREISFTDLVSFEEIDFLEGVMKGVEWYPMINGQPITVTFDKILDTDTFYQLVLSSPS